MSDLYFFFAESFLTHILISGHKTEHSFTFFSLLFLSPITIAPSHRLLHVIAKVVRSRIESLVDYLYFFFHVF